MSVAEMKKIIVEKLDALSQEQLVDLEQFIDGINNPTEKEYDLMQHVENIVSDRGDVLKKLAK